MSDPAPSPEFLWGVATSAQQIEGAWDEGGRSPSIWDHFATLPGKIADGRDARVTCDHFHRWRDDVRLLEWLGVNAYRFSISWPRVLPGGNGPVNTRGLDFYDGLVDALLAAAIQPIVTLYHWDLPQTLQERGGWTRRETVDAFTEFTDAVTRRLGDRVRYWVTHNEPWCVAHLGHEQGVHAPGLRSPMDALRAAHHLLLSHGRAVDVLRRNAPGCEVGIVNILVPIHPASDSEADREAARRADGACNRWYLDPIFRGRYPADAVADRVRRGHLATPELDFVHPEDLACVSRPIDFLGVNYYSRTIVQAGPDGEPQTIRTAPEGERTDMGWEVYPEGLYEVLTRVHREYAPPRILITENGAAFPDGPDGPQRFADPRRVEYLRAHIAQARRAAESGVPLCGYFVWSLMDNFEWGHGMRMRFGLCHVDYETLRRTPRESARWYRDMISRTENGGPVQSHTIRRSP